MAWIRHDSHAEAVIKNRQALGDASPLETDADGYAEVADDETAERLTAMDSHVSLANPPSDGGGTVSPTESPAEALAREHWQTAVSAIEAGDADDYLDELEELDDRQSVLDAIDERRA